MGAIQSQSLQFSEWLFHIVRILNPESSRPVIIRQPMPYNLMPYKGTRYARFVTIRRGGTLSDEHHRLMALWAAKCAEHVLHLFEDNHTKDCRPQRAIEQARAWARGEITMTQAREAAFEAHRAAREAEGAAKEAARAAGHAVAVAHMADHELGAAAYAIRAVMEAGDSATKENRRKQELEWQKAQLPDEIKDLVLDDMKWRNAKCWSLFDD